jgi:hypothetical protein
MGAAVLGKGALIGKMENLRAEPVWKRGKDLAVRFSYTAGGRDISVAAFFRKTVQGWKLVRVAQV